MKFSRALMTFALATLVTLSSAKAAIVDYTGNQHNAGTVAIGQTGTILNNAVALTFLSATGYGELFGYLPADSRITFHYSILSSAATRGHTLPSFGTDASLYATGSYNYTKNGTRFYGASTAETDNGITYSGHTVHNGVNTNSDPLVLAYAHISDTKHGTTTITNYSSSAAYFMTALVALEKIYGQVVVSYTVTSVPLPASLPMFALAIAGMIALAYRQKTRA